KSANRPCGRVNFTFPVSPLIERLDHYFRKSRGFMIIMQTGSYKCTGSRSSARELSLAQFLCFHSLPLASGPTFALLVRAKRGDFFPRPSEFASTDPGR